MDKSEIDSILQEIGGFRINPGMTNPGPSRGRFDHLANRNQAHPLISPRGQYKPKFQLTPWQLELKEFIIANRGDILVNVNPAGGKTKPCIDGWQESYARNHVARNILWVTPTVQLANQVYHVDLRSAITEMVAKWTSDPNESSFPLRLLPPMLQHELIQAGHTNASEFRLTPTLFNELQDWISNTAMYFKARGNSQGTLTQNTIAATCTYPYAVEIMKVQRPKIVVIDELQQYVPIGATEHDDITSQASDFLKLLLELTSDTMLIFLTGSMNSVTANQIADFMNRNFNRRVEVFQRSASNRAFIQVVPHDKLRTKEDIISIAKQAIYDKEVGSAMALFSVKNEDPAWRSKKAIMPIAMTLLDKLPQRSIETVTGYKSTFDEQRGNIDEYLPLKTTPKLVNGQIIQQDITMADAAKVLSKKHEDPQWWSNQLAYMLWIGEQQKLGNSPVPRDEFGPKAFPDPILARCILAGFGYMAGGKDRDRAMNSPDIMLVQALFKAGRIHFLFATDMIGVGTTLTIKKLYLPSLNKFDPKFGKPSPMDDSTLVQLINRVGRQTGISATVYCSRDERPRIVNALTTDPSSTVEPALFGGGKSGLEKALTAKQLNDAIIALLQAVRVVYSA